MNAFEIKDRFRKNLTKYILQAYHSFPEMDNPDILDLGCGTGESSIFLSGISNGSIFAVDSDSDALEWFKKKLHDKQLDERIKVIQSSVFDVDFQGKKFDIVLAEGLFNIIGFKKGLSLVNKHINPGGMLIIHDELADEDSKEKLIREMGYAMINSFKLPDNTWREDYFLPMETFLKSARIDNSDPQLKDLWIEIEFCKKYPERCRSIYYILQKQQKNK